MNLKSAIAIGGSAAIMLRHALCVFPVLPSLMLNENPLVVPPLLGNNTMCLKVCKARGGEEEEPPTL